MENKIIKSDYVASAVKSSQYPEEVLPEIVFMGRSNVGKSSLINSLCNRRNLARTSQVPGKTQTLSTAIYAAVQANDYDLATPTQTDEKEEERLSPIPTYQPSPFSYQDTSSQNQEVETIQELTELQL